MHWPACTSPPVSSRIRFVKTRSVFSNCFLPVALKADNDLPLQSLPHLNPHTVTAEMWLHRDLGIPQAFGSQGIISQVRNAIPSLPGSPTCLCPSIGRQSASLSLPGCGFTERLLRGTVPPISGMFPQKPSPRSYATLRRIPALSLPWATTSR